MIPKRLQDEINRWINEGRYGSVQINFQGGRIVNINRSESIKVEQLDSNSIGTITATVVTGLPL